MKDGRRLILVVAPAIAVAVAAGVAVAAPTIGVAIGVGFVLLLIAFLSKPERVVAYAIGFSVLSAMLLPTFGSPNSLRGEATIAAIAFNVIALSRSPRKALFRFQTIALVVYFVILAGYQLVAGLNLQSQAAVLLVFWMLSLAAVLAKCDATAIKLVVGIIIGVACVESVLGVLEVAGIAHPLWGYLGTGKTLEERVNFLVPQLPGRAVATMAQPIPLGLLAGFGFILVLFGWTAKRLTFRITVAVVLACGVAVSGTRSAVLCAAICVAFAFIQYGSTATKVRNAIIVAIALGFSSALVDLPGLLGLTNIQDSFSYTNRLNSISSFASLFSRPVNQVLFGSGPSSNSTLNAFQYLQADGFSAIDNQFVTTFAVTGILGLALIVAAIVLGFTEASLQGRAVLLFSTAMFFSFDSLTWSSSAVLFMVAAGLFTRANRDRSGFLNPSLETVDRRDQQLVLTGPVEWSIK
jgi:hypothetical protein